MSRLLKAEMYKLKKTTAFKVLIILSIFFALMSIGITKLISSEDYNNFMYKTACKFFNISL